MSTPVACVLALLGVLLIMPARADMFPDGSNAKLPATGTPAASVCQTAPGSLMASAAGCGLSFANAVCDGTTDNAAALAAAEAKVAAAGGGTIYLPVGVCATSQTLNLGNGHTATTTLTANASAGATSLQVASIAGIQAGDGVGLTLNDGSNLVAFVAGTPSGSTVNIDYALTGPANSGNVVGFGTPSTYTVAVQGLGAGGSDGEFAAATGDISVIKYIGTGGATVPVINIKGPMASPALRNFKIDANSLAGYGVYAIHPHRGDFNGVVVVHYNTAGWHVESVKTYFKGNPTQMADNVFIRSHAIDPGSTSAIGLDMYGGPEGNVGCSRNTFIDNEFDGGGGTATASPVRLSFCDNNHWYGMFGNFVPIGDVGNAPGVYFASTPNTLATSFAANFPSENVWHASAILHGFGGPAVGTGLYNRVTDYSVGDGEPTSWLSKNFTGSTTNGTTFGLNTVYFGTNGGQVTVQPPPSAGAGTFILPITNIDMSAAWTAYTPAVACSTGTIGANTSVGRYKKLGDKTTAVTATLTITTNNTCAGSLSIGLPSTANSNATLVGREFNATGKAVIGSINSGAAYAFTVNGDNTYPGGSGYAINISGVYENQ